MRLYIAEKPSLGRAIASALPGKQKNHISHIEFANGDCVSWCVGHLLEQATPDEYDDTYKQWRRDSLPILPKNWQLKPKSQTKKQLSILKKLVKKADVIVHAGDPDREGQLLVDQLLDYLNITAKQKQNTLRCLISDMNASAVKKSLTSMQPNSNFKCLSISGLARARADWLYGMNLTRAFTLSGQKSGYKGVLSVGRVQTPLLALVVRRDEDIAAFKSHPFYEVYAKLEATDADSAAIYAKWKPSEACEPYQDDQGRVLSKPLAENVISRIQGQPAQVKEADVKPKKQLAPLPYNLSALQIDAAKRYALSAKKVLDICQQLYEKHKLITYPRSDCRYIPEDHFLQARQVVKAIGSNSARLTKHTQGADLSLKNRAWNDKKTGAHHAIIPTLKSSTSALNELEANIYFMIARQYLAQFYPAYVTQEQAITFDIAGGCFIAKASLDQSLGWKVLFQPSQIQSSQSNKVSQQQARDEKQKFTNQNLSQLKEGDILTCLEGILDEKETTAPAYFTDATLLAAMTGISRFVCDPMLRKTLKETDGLGTEATRAGIIEILFKRRFIKREGRYIRSTQPGRALINGLPERVTLPDLTAHWEHQLDTIKSKALTYDAFMAPLTEQIGRLVSESDQCLFDLSHLDMADRAQETPQKRYKRKNTARKAPRNKSRKGGVK